MILIDANLLIYAYDRNSPHGERAREWLESVLAREPAIGLAWTAALAFLRLTTQPRMLQRPLTAEAACGVIGRLLEHPSVQLVTPGPRHWAILGHDRHFERFRGLRSEYPI